MAIPSRAEFDSDFYLAHNPDVADALANWIGTGLPDWGNYTSIGGTVKDSPIRADIAFHHFETSGFAENRPWRNKVTGVVHNVAAMPDPAIDPPPPATDYSSQIDALYVELLGRHADAQGLANYNANMNAGWTLAHVRSDIMASNEYAAHQAALAAASNGSGTTTGNGTTTGSGGTTPTATPPATTSGITSLPIVGPLIGSISTSLGVSPTIVAVGGVLLLAFAFGAFGESGGRR